MATDKEAAQAGTGDQEPKIILDNSGEGNTVVFEHDDIIPATKIKLGNYLSKITKDAGNYPSIKQGSENISTTTGTGNPKPISDSDNNAETTFTKETVQDAVSEFTKASDSDFLDQNSKSFNVRIAKGKTDDGTRITVGKYYNDVNRNLGDSEIARAVESRQLENNRYNLSNKYLDPNKSLTENESGVGTAYLQQALGNHTPRKWPNVPNNNEEVKFKINNIKNLGIQMLLESSGEYYVPEDTDSIGSTILAKAVTTAPGLARMGLRVRNNRFSATEIAGQVNNKFQNNSKFPELKDNANLSYGSVNNPLVPFSALNTSNAQAGAILLATTIGIMMQALSLAIAKLGPNDLLNPVAAVAGGLFGKKRTSSIKSEQQFRHERLGKGSHRELAAGEDESKNKYSLPGLTVITGNDTYSACVTRGFEIFFDAPSGGIGKQILGAGVAAANAATGGILEAIGVPTPYDKIVDAPGYYNAILRMLVQSATADILGLVGTAVTLTGNSTGAESIGVPGALDINRNIGLDSDPTNLLNSIGQFQNSRVIKFMNILATLGDLDKGIASGDGGVMESTIDAILDKSPNTSEPFTDDAGLLLGLKFPNPAALIKKSRLSEDVGRYAGKLAWGSNTLRTMYSLPDSLIKAKNVYFGGRTGLESNPNFLSIQNNRIEQKYVEAIESELDSYYMPFYFHDIRTNEIISFHAFMDNVSDGYEADYTESETYGRIGKVYTYKNTNRNISFSFKIVATNPQDFDDMWFKINKLVTLVYPQYTAGRSVDTGNGKFIQPFSQLISNSPLIRVRLGDLFKTNYSEFDLARLFGIGTEQFNLDASVTTDITPAHEELDIEAQTKVQETIDRINASPPDLIEGDRIIILPFDVILGKVEHKNIMLQGPAPHAMTRLNKVPATSFRATVTGDDQKYNHYKIEANKEDLEADIPTNLTIHKGPPAAVGYTISADMDYYNNLILNKSLIDVPATTKTTKVFDQSKIDDFFKPENNPIVKSFESVAGQGQAGFIKSIAFDFADAQWQTEGLNNRAPMLCKVDITFAPVFDINPGLDSSGSPIGLPYNVGSLMKILKISRRKSLVKAQTSYSVRKNAANIASSDKKIEQSDLLKNGTAGFTGG